MSLEAQSPNVKVRLRKVALGILAAVCFVAPMAALQMLMHHAFGEIVSSVVLAPIYLLWYVAIARFVEQRKAGEILTPVWGRHVGIGFALGIAIFGAALAVAFAGGSYHVSGFNGIGAIYSGLVFWTSAALFEELIFRAYVYRVLQDAIGSWPAIFISSAFFGAAHALNPHASVISCIGIALQAGVLFGVAYMVTQNIWLATGIHIGWNFAEGTIFGTPVSGFAVRDTLLHGTLRGPFALTGGAFGIEESAQAALVCIVAACLLVAWSRTKRDAQGRVASRAATPY